MKIIDSAFSALLSLIFGTFVLAFVYYGLVLVARVGDLALWLSKIDRDMQYVFHHHFHFSSSSASEFRLLIWLCIWAFIARKIYNVLSTAL